VPVTPPPVAADVPTLLGHVGNFLGQHGFPVRDFQMVDAANAQAGAAGYAGVATPGHVGFSPAMLAQLRGLAGMYGRRRGQLTDAQVEALRVATHEGIHQMRFGRTPEVYSTPRGRRMEEAATEAATQDILPILTTKLFGYRLPGARVRDAFGGTDYPGLTRQLRQLSVFGSGARDFTARPARVWRRTFVHADEAGRERMWDEAVQKRTALAEARR
jgi:hypothetical protein